MTLPFSQQGSSNHRTDLGLKSYYDRLFGSARYYMSEDLAPSTLKAYNCTRSWFIQLCFSSIIPVVPTLEITVCSFIVYSYPIL